MQKVARLQAARFRSGYSCAKSLNFGFLDTVRDSAAAHGRGGYSRIANKHLTPIAESER